MLVSEGRSGSDFGHWSCLSTIRPAQPRFCVIWPHCFCTSRRPLIGTPFECSRPSLPCSRFLCVASHDAQVSCALRERLCLGQRGSQGHEHQRHEHSQIPRICFHQLFTTIRLSQALFFFPFRDSTSVFLTVDFQSRIFLRVSFSSQLSCLEVLFCVTVPLYEGLASKVLEG